MELETCADYFLYELSCGVEQDDGAEGLRHVIRSLVGLRDDDE